MGRQRGLVHISGQFDDVQLSIDGKHGVAKLSVPMTKDRIKNDPDMENTRKVNAEFTAASLATDALQRCTCGRNYSFGDRYLRSRLQGKLNGIVRRGAGDFGKRMLEVLPNKESLKGLALHPSESFSARLTTAMTVDVNADRNTATLTVPSFVSKGRLHYPEGSTHFRVFVCVGVLSDFQYVGGEAVYEAVNPTINGVNAEAYSAYMDVTGQNAGFQVIAALPGLPVLPGTAGLVVSMGIEFFFDVNSNYNLKAVGNAMEIYDVF